jgi:hypothetical protein
MANAAALPLGGWITLTVYDCAKATDEKTRAPKAADNERK